MVFEMIGLFFLFFFQYNIKVQGLRKPKCPVLPKLIINQKSLLISLNQQIIFLVYVLGPNCEVCEPGFYGDATTGTPLDCNICECPLGIVSNSFATECSLNSVNDLICTCKEGYVGQRCNKCADGFYGDPSDPGDYCKRCGCSGNIDYNVNGSCDSLTGECLKCINTATGDQCDRCLNGYYGDAVVAKNCARCACNDCGTVTAVCNHTTGSCMCKPNVIGESCDSCKVISQLIP